MENLIVYPSTVIYIVCPANISTGGPTLLHQLGSKLKAKSIKVKMFYINKVDENPVHKDYLKYNLDYVTEINNESNIDIIIIPESFTKIYFNFKYIRKVFWWLSVDFYVNQTRGRKNRIKYFLHYHPNTYFIDRDKNQETLHLAQSHYALEFLKKNYRKNIGMLSDYLDSDFINLSDQIDTAQKQNVVLYNPKKGLDFTKKLIECDPTLNWHPIEGLSPEEVRYLLIKSKVYIDFGNHPGKDRFPREAAICKCCIITGKRGSANFYNDLPINDKYKFLDKIEDAESIIQRIKECLIHFDNNLIDSENYRSIIKQEEEVFDRQLDALLSYKNI